MVAARAFGGDQQEDQIHRPVVHRLEFDGLIQPREEAAGWGWQTAHHPEDFLRVMKEWPLALATARDLVVVAGGIGLAPLRPVIDAVLDVPEPFTSTPPPRHSATP